ncbi:hypothetical protein FRC11_012050, partial [Ceratobasidium sp. 423]
MSLTPLTSGSISGGSTKGTGEGQGHLSRGEDEEEVEDQGEEEETYNKANTALTGIE